MKMMLQIKNLENLVLVVLFPILIGGFSYLVGHNFRHGLYS